MANVGKWTVAGSIATVLSTEIDLLGNGTFSTLSAAYDNSANLNLYAIFELVYNWNSHINPRHFSLYFFPTLDGTNYADATPTAKHLCVAVFELGQQASGRAYAPRAPILLPPLKGKFALYSNHASTTDGNCQLGTGNTVKLIPLNINLNG